MFKVLPDTGKRIYLDCTFLKADEGKEIIIKSGDTLIADYTLSYDGNDEKFVKSFELPASLTEGQNELRIIFTGNPVSDSARLAAPVNTSWI